jgi:hypothetical protein
MLGTWLASAVEFFSFEVPKALIVLTLIPFGVGVTASLFRVSRFVF